MPFELHGDPVAAFDHVLGHLGMRSVDVVEQRRGEERGKLDGQENQPQKRPNRQRRRLFDQRNSRILWICHSCKALKIKDNSERRLTIPGLGMALSMHVGGACGCRGRPAS